MGDCNRTGAYEMLLNARSLRISTRQFQKAILNDPEFRVDFPQVSPQGV
jgi:hypothetical protein